MYSNETVATATAYKNNINNGKDVAVGNEDDATDDDDDDDNGLDGYEKTSNGIGSSNNNQQNCSSNAST